MLALGAATVVCVAIQRVARRGWIGFVIPFAIVLAGATGYLRYIGYLGGPVFHVTPAAADRPPPPYAIVFMSGDMGDRVGMGRQLIARMSADGIPVVALNTLRAFRTTQSTAQATTLVVEAIARARALSGSHRVVLIGMSFGADMLQVAAAGLPPASRRDVTALALVVPGDTLDFRASPSELFSFGETLVDARPSASALGWVPTLCIWGVEETDSLCPSLDPHRIRVVGLPGGHPLNRNVDRVYATLKQTFADPLPR
jgi:type IV secretory pathway VirJ component